jgi:hypothetical protein
MSQPLTPIRMNELATTRDEPAPPNRMRQAAFPAAKTLQELDVATSLIPEAAFDYLASLEWVRATESTCLVGPAGT